MRKPKLIEIILMIIIILLPLIMIFAEEKYDNQFEYRDVVVIYDIKIPDIENFSVSKLNSSEDGRYYSLLIGNNGEYKEMPIYKKDTIFEKQPIEKPILKVIYRKKFEKVDPVIPEQDYRNIKDKNDSVEYLIKYRKPEKYKIIMPEGTF